MAAIKAMIRQVIANCNMVRLSSKKVSHAVVNALRWQKKTDVAEHPKACDHVGLLANEPLGKAGLLSF